jgi:hypothetical protein
MTFKEWMRRPHPELDKLADEAERQRALDEEYSYDKKQEGCIECKCQSFYQQP